jgi:hypothetical protein
MRKDWWFAVGLAIAASMPSAAKAQDDGLTRVLVNVADVVLRDGQPYYRGGQYAPDDRLIVARDRYGRPIYYRVVRRDRDGDRDRDDDRDRFWDDDDRYVVRPTYPAYFGGIDPGASTARRVTCNKQGNCTVTYYDPHYDRRGHSGRHRTPVHYWDGYRWRSRDR